MIKCTFENGKGTSLRHVIVDALVLRDDEILLVKRTRKLLEGGKWAIIGGFLDRDETLVDAVSREVHEETGWRVKNIKLLEVVDNPNRPNEDRQNVAFIYTCQAVEKDGKADWESDEVRWFKLSNLPPKEEFAFDHFEDIQFYLKNNK
ncbi:hypothetical protein A2870_01985 [Candidatus Curtissbacteria bacterium RIFCSPHIGHO2_01_FULL_41_11]|uniref:Nudix hydrolase domain-containing protein n=1 Tax=Candidatus Curtissbacteria bacterium RIFCSPHIGHO2_01_FULL_41_11 TaxID=1797711 RepID=A0A1F5G3U3_9BACT|nr:MAG: hypothetical protein A2870_01985 [Candidatus Curtissbacteria bacterium RIFCSPHIGHO2_01_FULL_41_11]